MNPNINFQGIINITNNIKKEINSGLMDSLLDNLYEYDNKDDLLVKYNNIIFQIIASATYNHNNNIFNNISSINLGECKNILKEKYKINRNKSLLIFMVSYFIEEINIPIIRLEIFNPVNKEQLNINYCKNSNIHISMSISINEEHSFKYNPNNDYYNDICFHYANEKGTDMVLIDRKKEFNMNKMSLCEANCNF